LRSFEIAIRKEIKNFCFGIIEKIALKTRQSQKDADIVLREGEKSKDAWNIVYLLACEKHTYGHILNYLNFYKHRKIPTSSKVGMNIPTNISVHIPASSRIEEEKMRAKQWKKQTHELHNT
jgi:hypothetical protein